MSAAYLAADVLGVAEERVRALAAQGVLPCDAEGLFPIQAAVDAYVAHLSAVEEAGELGRFRAEEADRLAARQKGGQSAAVVGHHFRVKWSFMWPAFLRDREERGAGGKLRPAVLARVTLAEYRKHRKAAFGEDDPATPRKRTVEDWFRQWEKDFPEAQSEASQAIARLK